MRRAPVLSAVAIIVVSVSACYFPVGKIKPPVAPVASNGNPIVRENERPGQRGWYQSSTPTGIAGYATTTSVAVGGLLDIAVSTTAPAYSIDVYRVGWYGGAGARRVLTVHNLRGQNYGQWQNGTFGVQSCPTCTYDIGLGLLQLNWPATYMLKVPTDWVSGNFVAKLTTRQGAVGYVPFIVRDSRPSALLAVMPVNTYEAYNMWGGKSLYSNSLGPLTRGVGDNVHSALKVSFERPYAAYEQYVKNDYKTVQFLEREGYDVTYAGSVDLDRDAELLRGHRIVLSVGHDEYWSLGMRNAVESGRDHRLDVVFLGGNDIYWQVRYEPDPIGRDHEVLVCYRDASLDPSADSSTKTVRWVDRPVSRAQDSLTGTIYTGRVLDHPTPWVAATTAPAWLMGSTGLRTGSSIPDLVGLECDGVVTSSARPYGWESSSPPPGMVLVSDSPVVTASGQPLVCNTIYYQAVGGGQVFSVGTWSWQDFLGGPRQNAAVVRMTENVFTRFGARE